MLFKKKRKIDYTFSDYCRKQITLYQSMQDTDLDQGKKKLYEEMIGRYELMEFEYKRFLKEKELMERKNINEG